MPSNDCVQCFALVFAILFPPIGVLIYDGCGCDLLINICLTLLGFLPGIIHAMYIIFGRKDDGL